jgi:hypothetical protein
MEIEVFKLEYATYKSVKMVGTLNLTRKEFKQSTKEYKS